MSLVVEKKKRLAEYTASFWQWWLYELDSMYRDIRYLKRKAVLSAEISEDGSLVRDKQDEPASNRVNLLLTIADNHVLYRKVSLPAAVKTNIRQVVRYEFDKYFPIPESDVLIGHKIISESVHGQIEVGIWVVKKEIIDEVTGHLSRDGYSIASTEIKTQAGDLIIRVSEDKTDIVSMKSVSRTRMMVNSALLVACLFVPVIKMDYQIRGLEEKISELESNAKDVIAVRARMLEMDELLNLVISEKNSSPDVVAIWSDITKIISSKAQVARLQIKDKKVTLEGSAVSVEQIVMELEQHDRFSQVAIDAPVRSVNKGMSESMKLSFQVDSK